MAKQMGALRDSLRRVFGEIVVEALQVLDDRLVQQLSTIDLPLSDQDRVVLRQYAIWGLAQLVAVAGSGIQVPDGWDATNAIEALCSESRDDADVLEAVTRRLVRRLYNQGIRPNTEAWLNESVAAVMDQPGVNPGDFADVNISVLAQHRRLYVEYLVNLGELNLSPWNIRNRLPLAALRQRPGKDKGKGKRQQRGR
jgi:hypothetical protein